MGDDDYGDGEAHEHQGDTVTHGPPPPTKGKLTDASSPSSVSFLQIAAAWLVIPPRVAIATQPVSPAIVATAAMYVEERVLHSRGTHHFHHLRGK